MCSYTFYTHRNILGTPIRLPIASCIEHQRVVSRSRQREPPKYSLVPRILQLSVQFALIGVSRLRNGNDFWGCGRLCNICTSYVIHVQAIANIVLADQVYRNRTSAHLLNMQSSRCRAKGEGSLYGPTLSRSQTFCPRTRLSACALKVRAVVAQINLEVTNIITTRTANS